MSTRRSKKHARDVTLASAFKKCSELPEVFRDFPEFGDAAHHLVPERSTWNDIAWDELPPGVDPSFGDLSGYRAQRKRNQIESMARVVVSIAEPGDRIVEIGAGTGHLGILLAYLLPECHVVLIEREAFRVGLAQKRLQQAGLHNIELCAADAQQYGREAIAARYGPVTEPYDNDGNSLLAPSHGPDERGSLPLDSEDEHAVARSVGKPFQIGIGLHTCGLLSDVRACNMF